MDSLFGSSTKILIRFDSKKRLFILKFVKREIIADDTDSNGSILTL